MISAIITAYRAASNIRKLVMTVLFFVAIISGLLAAKSLWFAAHDNQIRTQTRAEITQKTAEQVKTDEENINTFNDAINDSFVKRLLPVEKTNSSDSEQNSAEELPEKIPDANAKGADVSGIVADSGLGDADALYSTDLSATEIAEVLQAHIKETQKAGKKYCYAQELLDENGHLTGETIVTCDDDKSIKKGGGG